MFMIAFNSYTCIIQQSEDQHNYKHCQLLQNDIFNNRHEADLEVDLDLPSRLAATNYEIAF